MITRRLQKALVVMVLLASGCSAVHLVPPVVARKPFVQTVHGSTRADDFHWLREKDNPEVIEYLTSENDHTQATLAPLSKLQKTLYREFLARIEEDDTEVPFRQGDWQYYSRTETGKDYRIYCRTPISGGAEQVILDLNAFADQHDYVGRGAMEVSDDGRWLAYAIDFTGFRDLHLYVRDLESGHTSLVSSERITSLAWAADNRTLFYAVEDDSKRPSHVLRTVIGSGTVVAVFDEPDRQFNVGVGRVRSGKYIAISSASSDTADARLIDARRPHEPPRLVAERINGQEYYIDHAGGDRLFIRTNDTGRNFRLVASPVNSSVRAGWDELIAHRDDVMIEDHNCFDGFAVLSERAGGLPRLSVRHAADGTLQVIPMQEAIYNVSISHNEVFETHLVRYQYESPVTPESTFDFDVTTGKSILLKRDPAPSYDASQYEVAQLLAVAPDGVQVPISIVRKRGLPAGPKPLWLHAYGAYGLPETDDFSPTRFSMLDRGVVFAIAHIRGGGEMGKIWHEQGRLMNKRNTFTDFIACAEHLINQGVTSPQQLVISGFSAGGLTMGAVLNMRPELFKAAIVGVPFVDVINTMLDDSLPLTTQEYLEWGNPHDPSAFDYMLSYSPYDNIAAKEYPAMYVYTGLNDSQVMYWEPAKYTAKLRATKTDNNPLLLRCVMSGGHGGPSGRYDDLKEEARQQAFLLWQLGIDG